MQALCLRFGLGKCRLHLTSAMNSRQQIVQVRFLMLCGMGETLTVADGMELETVQSV